MEDVLHSYLPYIKLQGPRNSFHLIQTKKNKKIRSRRGSEISRSISNKEEPTTNKQLAAFVEIQDSSW